MLGGGPPYRISARFVTPSGGDRRSIEVNTSVSRCPFHPCQATCNDIDNDNKNENENERLHADPGGSATAVQCVRKDRTRRESPRGRPRRAPTQPAPRRASGVCECPLDRSSLRRPRSQWRGGAQVISFYRSTIQGSRVGQNRCTYVRHTLSTPPAYWWQTGHPVEGGHGREGSMYRFK